MSSADNTDQADYWAGPSGLSWITHQEEMDSVLASVKDVLLDGAGDVRGLDVLDIGCGAGAVSLAFADAGAKVVASDISEPLLKHAADRGAGRIETLLADAQTATWPRSFDLAVSRFGVMFFSNPAQAFANIAAGLRSGGRMIFAAWGPFDENPWWYMPQQIAARRLGLTPTETDPRAPGPMGLSDKDWALAQMRGPALQDVQCETVDITVNHHGGAGAAGTLATRLGPAARVLNMHDGSEADRAHVAEEISEALSAYTQDGTTRIPARLYLYTARKV